MFSAVTSISPSPFSKASHRLIVNTHFSLVCLSLIVVVSMNHEGFSPELSFSKVISSKGPNDSYATRTNPSILPRENISFDSSLFRS